MTYEDQDMQIYPSIQKICQKGNRKMVHIENPLSRHSLYRYEIVLRQCQTRIRFFLFVISNAGRRGRSSHHHCVPRIAYGGLYSQALTEQKERGSIEKMWFLPRAYFLLRFAHGVVLLTA